MTGGRIKACSKYFDSTFMLTYGDGLSDVNLRNLIKTHVDSDSLLTLTSVNPKSRYGLLNISESGQLIDFSEKPSLVNDWVNAGFMVAEPQIFDLLKVPRLSLKTLHSKAYPCSQVGVYKHYGFWQCMDTLREKNYLEELWAKNESPWPQIDYPNS